MEGAHVFIQVGASRDGLDAYLDAARRRGLSAWLVETPEYARCRELLGRREFDRTITVEAPSDPNTVLKALSSAGAEVAIVLPGFEQYTECAYVVASWLGVPPCSALDVADGGLFHPPDKAAQRRAIEWGTPWVRQPRYLIIEPGEAPPHGLSLPAVVKPANSGGGWGVFLARTEVELGAAVEAQARLLNYDGNHFRRVVVEEYVSGTEYSVQGICRDEGPQILTLCEKFVAQGTDAVCPRLVGFREVGHLGVAGEHVPADLKRMAADCLRAIGYRNGPFHADIIRAGGVPYFIELGFRLSGGALPELVRRVSGADWADEAFGWLLRREPPTEADARGRGCHAQLVAQSAAELEAARELCALGYEVEVKESSRPAAPLPEAEDLQADLSRHIGRAGVVRIAAQNLEDLRELARRVFGAGAPANTEEVASIAS